MAYVATIIPVMIASPSDVPAERAMVREVIHKWNYINSRKMSIVLMPTGWETHSAPEIGRSTGQDLINTRILKHCDLLIGVFWTRLGSPTNNFQSGTAEEIQKHIEDGKPVLVYFSDKPIPPSHIDENQYRDLLNFKLWCRQRGLTQEFSSIEEFGSSFFAQLGIVLNENEYLSNILQTSMSSLAGSLEDKQVANKLSSAAEHLLNMASEDGEGYIERYADSGSFQIKTHKQSFVNIGNSRSEIMWESALKELEKNGFVQDTGRMRELFKLTDSGFNFIDSIKRN